MREPPPGNSLPARSSFQACCLSIPTSPPRPLQFRTERKAQQQDMGLPVYLWSTQWNLTSRSLETQPGYVSRLLMKQGPPSLPCSNRAFPEMKRGMQRKHGISQGLCDIGLSAQPSLVRIRQKTSAPSQHFGRQILQPLSASIVHAISRVIKELCRVRGLWGIRKLLCKSLRTAPKLE